MLRAPKLGLHEYEKCQEPKVQTRFDAAWMPEPNSGCHLWLGAGTGLYGRFTISPRHKVMAHRVAYQIYKGRVAAGELVLHTCDVPTCVNPDHLYLGNYASNSADTVRRNRSKTNYTALQVYAMLADKGTDSLVALARKHSISRTALSQIYAHRSYRHLSRDPAEIARALKTV